jgi:hypothetical protein
VWLIVFALVGLVLDIAGFFVYGMENKDPREEVAANPLEIQPAHTDSGTATRPRLICGYSLEKTGVIVQLCGDCMFSLSLCVECCLLFVYPHSVEMIDANVDLFIGIASVCLCTGSLLRWMY